MTVTSACARRENSASQLHYPGLDGLRGVAILLVLLFHSVAAPQGSSPLEKFVRYALSGTWTGVDLFFVLSGFLITGILIDAKTSAKYLRTFYSRRVLRIVPAYAVFVAFMIWIAPRFGMISLENGQLASQLQSWYWGYGLNILIALRGWSAVPVASHLWSLSLEEQFYLLWPAIVLSVSVRRLCVFTIVLFAAAELARIVVILTMVHAEANYVLLPTRSDSLATGAFLACAIRMPDLWIRVNEWKLRSVSLAMLALVVSFCFYHSFEYDRPLTQLVCFPAIAIASGALLVSATMRDTWLSNSFLRFCGRFSYAMYLWHGVGISIALSAVATLGFAKLADKQLANSFLVVSCAFVLTTLLALASWILIERPFLNLKRHFSYEPTLPRVIH